MNVGPAPAPAHPPAQVPYLAVDAFADEDFGLMDPATFDIALHTKNNSPAKGSQRAARTPTGAWLGTKRLVDHEKNEDGFTHICLLRMADGTRCNRLHKSTYNKKQKCWISNIPNEHMVKWHPNDPHSKKLIASEMARREKTKGTMITAGLEADACMPPGKNVASAGMCFVE